MPLCARLHRKLPHIPEVSLSNTDHHLYMRGNVWLYHVHVLAKQEKEATGTCLLGVHACCCHHAFPCRCHTAALFILSAHGRNVNMLRLWCLFCTSMVWFDAGASF